MKSSIAIAAPAIIQPMAETIPLYEARRAAVPQATSAHPGALRRIQLPRGRAVITDLWYKNAIIYSLDLETFMDGNGDGCGDFHGLMQRLDYLESLGIDVLWLAPFQPSPNRDNGYDISDFYGVDPRHGSSGEFVEFMNQANKRGIGVIIDLVVNHTSDRHPWFQAARSGASSPLHDWYIWSKKRPAGWNKGMVFPGVQKAVWTLDKRAREYYYHVFYEFQPDLNMDNPDVRAEIMRIMGYWLQLGVAGFRVDAVPFIIQGSPLEKRRTPRLHFEWLEEMRRFLQWRSRDAILLGEANVLPQDNMRYFGDDGQGIQMMFNFFVNQHLFYALASEDTEPLANALRRTAGIPNTSQWAQFLRNHDELDLGRLTERQRQRVFERFGPDPGMQLYHRGIRRRLAPMLGDRRNMELAYSMLFSLPGTPVIRYGDEIGMGENLDLPERAAVRTPMQWSGEHNAGFSLAQRLPNPVITAGVYGCEQVNVEKQRRDPQSFLNWLVRIIRQRKETPEIGWGEYSILPTGHRSVLGLMYEWRGNRVVLLHNFSRQPVEVTLRIKGEGGDLLTNLLAESESRAQQDGAHRVAIEEFGYRWFRVGGLGYALKRLPGRPYAQSPA
jgi:maltose alpha-D-glucosyltransferase/alpha-amylase